MESGFLLEHEGIKRMRTAMVSILVLMESGFLQERRKAIKHYNERFYPCFNGIRVLTTSLYEVLPAGMKTPVSILVLMESGFLQNTKVKT